MSIMKRAMDFLGLGPDDAYKFDTQSQFRVNLNVPRGVVHREPPERPAENIFPPPVDRLESASIILIT